MNTHKMIHFVRQKISRTIIACFLTLAMGVLIPSLSAQTGKGTITGRVTNEATSLPLEGALVTLEGGSIKTLSGKDGSYRLVNVPSGSNTVVVAYAGLDTSRATAMVGSGSTAVANVGMTSEAYTLPNFQISAVREDQAAAINSQRTADNVKNVVATNAYGNVGESNLGNLLLKLPGISPERDEGDVVRISVRGIDPNLNSVSVDGTLLAGATTRGDNRALEIDKVSSNSIRSIEVIKAPTPDMDADSIGGKINLIMKDGFENEGQEKFSYTLGSNSFIEFDQSIKTGALGKNDTRGRTGTIKRFRSHPSGSLAYSSVFGKNDNIALMLTGSFNRSFSPRSAYRASYFNDGEVRYFDGSSVDGGVKLLNNFQHVEDDILLDRLGLSGKLTFKTGDDGKFFIRTMYNDFTDVMTQHKFRVFARNTELSEESPVARWNSKSRNRRAYAVAEENLVEFHNGEAEFEMESRDRTVTTSMFQIGGDRKPGNWEIDYNASTSDSKATERREDLALRFKGVGYRLDGRYDNDFPRITQVSGPSISDYDNSYVDDMAERDHYAWDTVNAGKLNVKRILDTELPIYVKAGLRYRSQEKRQDRRRDRFDYVGEDGVSGFNEDTGINDDGLNRFRDDGRSEEPVEGRYDQPVWPDWFALHDERRLNPQYFPMKVGSSVQNDLSDDRTAKEDITSYYVQSQVVKDKFTALVGVRVEDTKISGISAVQDENADNPYDEWGQTATFSGGYSSTFPGVHLKYDWSDQVVFRASFSTSVGRPNFDKLVPGTEIEEDEDEVGTGTIRQNNPDLNPQYSDNIDLSAEYYMKGIGLVSVGFFNKKITDFIYSDSYLLGLEEGFDPFNGEYDGWSYRTDKNGGWADVNGLEFNYQQHFTYLPGLLNAFGMYANYTLLDTKGTYGFGEEIVDEIPGFVEKTGNIGLSYIKHGWTVRTSLSYKGDSLRNRRNNPLDRQYEESRSAVDLSVLYEYKPSINFFMDILNLTNAHKNRYQGLSTRQVNSQIYGTKITAGISGRF